MLDAYVMFVLQVFFLQTSERSGRFEPVDLSRLAETLSSAVCVALSSKLQQLAEAGLYRLALRATIDNDNVSCSSLTCNRWSPPART